MSNFDLNIENYTKEELIDFFFDSDDEIMDLDKDNIKKKAEKMRKEALEKNQDKIVNFINKVENILIMDNYEYTKPDASFESFTSNIKRGHDVEHVFTKEFMEGTLNRKYKQTITKLINIDSQYKNIIETNNANTTNFYFKFTETLTNVISISLHSLELPSSWYAFNESNGTTIFMIDNIEYNISSGNYLPEELVIEINRVIDVDVTCELINHSGKIRFTNNSTSDVVIKFFSDSDQAFSNSKLNNNLGWLLGFRKEEILLNKDSSEASGSPVDVWGPRYIYLCLDDYNNNQPSRGLIGITKSDNNISASTITEPVNKVITGNNSNDISIQQFTTLKTITNTMLESENLKNKDRNKKLKPTYSAPVNRDYFAKIPINKPVISKDNYSIPLIEFTGPIQKNKREYFGPVNINSMRVKLLDDKGNILDINGLDWSFSLESTHVYQYGTPVKV